MCPYQAQPHFIFAKSLLIIEIKNLPLSKRENRFYPSAMMALL